MNAMSELGAIIDRKGLSLSEAAAHVGCLPEELGRWLAGEAEPSAFFREILPAVVVDIDRLCVDKE